MFINEETAMGVLTYESQSPELRAPDSQFTFFPCDQRKGPKTCWAACILLSLSFLYKNRCLEDEAYMEGDTIVGGRR